MEGGGEGGLLLGLRSQFSNNSPSLRSGSGLGAVRGAGEGAFLLTLGGGWGRVFGVAKQRLRLGQCELVVTS